MLLDGDIDEFKSYRHIQLHDDTIHAHTLEHSSYEQMSSHAWCCCPNHRFALRKSNVLISSISSCFVAFL